MWTLIELTCRNVADAKPGKNNLGVLKELFKDLRVFTAVNPQMVDRNLSLDGASTAYCC
jgi:hypothetical protein